LSSRDELYRTHAEGQTKFAYFVLGVAASAIAFAIHSTTGQALNWSHAPIGVAVILWSASFFFGLRYLSLRQGFLHINMDLAMLQEGRFRPEWQGMSPQEVEEIIRAAIAKADPKMGTVYLRQQWTLFGGALFYIAGHVLQMALLQPTPIKPQPSIAMEKAPPANTHSPPRR